MSGLAQQLFEERIGRPWNIHSENSVPWPLLSQLENEGLLSSLDLALAEELLPASYQTNEALAAALCHLSLAVRHGHLCTLVQRDQLTPPVATLWGELQAEEASNKASQDPQQFQKLAIEGHSLLQKEFVDEVFPGKESHRCLCRWGNRLYLQRQWHYEEAFCKHLSRLLAHKPTIALDPTFVAEKADRLLAQNTLEPQQAEALRRLCGTSITLISGGPGTGKTYTAGQMIETYWQALSPAQRRQSKIVLAAPTGKAAANLMSSLGRVAHSLEEFPHVQARTLHALLGIHQQHRQHLPSFPTLNEDLIIIDECSMIDVKLMAHLFASVKNGARLILLGDPDQLPPVESGGLFADLVHSPLKTKLGVELIACRRAEAQEIVSFAHTINTGDYPSIQSILKTKLSKAIQPLHLQGQSTAKKQQSLLKQILPHYPSLHPLDDPYAMLQAFQSFRLLTPLRQGPWGVDTLNSLLLHASHSQQRQKPFVMPVLIVQNDYRTQLFNGEVGVLVRYSPLKELQQPGRVDRLFDERDYAVFPASDSQNPVRRLPAVTLPKFEYAYCISVHKSQGSEFDHVALLLPEGSEAFGREVLYTAATRAKKTLHIHSEEKVMQQVLSKTSHRLSGMDARLAQMN